MGDGSHQNGEATKIALVSGKDVHRERMLDRPEHHQDAAQAGMKGG